MPKKAIIIGAGPAGLTLAFELLTRTNIKPIIVEKSEYMGGISRTINYKGNRIDIGGHRFFSKSDRVMEWWQKMLPVEDTGTQEIISYQGKTTEVKGSERNSDLDSIMLIRNRRSRIYFLRKFFDYPVKINGNTLANLGIVRMVKIGLSYIKIRLFPIKQEKNLEDFFINRFGKELYLTFFKSYTEKVWGIECDKISKEWGAQRIKGLSISKALIHFVKSLFTSSADISQKDTETSLIEKFLYPKFGPGQMWEEVAKKVLEMGGEIITESKVTKIGVKEKNITYVEYINKIDKKELLGDYFFSTMPIKELVKDLQTQVPKEIQTIANGLIYRDFMTVGLLCSDLKIKENTPQGKKIVSDNWIYIQEQDVQVGRLQIFNNWSPYMVKDNKTIWIGLEYFVNEGDKLWKMKDLDVIEFAKKELEKINILNPKEVIDSVVIRMEKTYPAYFGTYDRFEELRRYLDSFENLYLLGRNGMHRYNNQDHSMLTAMVAVDNIIAGIKTKDNLWSINSEEEYHEKVKKP